MKFPPRPCTLTEPEGRTFRIPGRSDGGGGPEKVFAAAAAAAQIKPSNHHVVKLVTFSSRSSSQSSTAERLNTVVRSAAACIIDFSPDLTMVSVLMVGLSYGARNVLPYTRRLMQNFLAFRDWVAIQ